MADFETALGYFEQLPAGWASFPTCVANASLLSAQQARGGLDGVFDGAPPVLRQLRDALVPNVHWIPEVVHVGMVLTVRDARFGPGPAEDDAFLAWLAKVNREILDGGGGASEAPVAAVGVDTVLSFLPALWEQFHGGCPLVVHRLEETRASVVVEHPAALFPPLSLETHRRPLAFALAKAGAAQLAIVGRTDKIGVYGRTELDCRWR